MAKYTYKDIIIDPSSEEAKNAIGKKCYMYDSPTMLLKMANSDDGARTLESIDESDYPFNDKEFGSEWTCIIVKKEEPKPKPKYVPFESKEEFIRTFDIHTTNLDIVSTEYVLLRYGMWVKSKYGEELYQVTIITRDGICTDDKPSIVIWEKLLDDFEFLDGTPCGKLAEENK